MKPFRGSLRFNLCVMTLLAVSTAFADDRRQPGSPSVAVEEPPDLNLLDAMRDGLVDVQAQGNGDGRMTVSVTNTSRRKLNVVLPPGLIASGAAGQYGGMGGMGGGMGGMGMGGMGGMGGGMGMGGMGGGMGMGMGGGRGMMGGRTMPPMMGMMMLSRTIMQLCGDYDSWDQRSLATGMMGGMGGMGMGGGMGGMGMGGMGGMGMGMRSIRPTSLPFASLSPGQTRKLPTRLVSLSPPAEDGSFATPAEGEPLQLGDVARLDGDPRVDKALRRLSTSKAPTRVAQMVMWNVAQGYDWPAIAQLARRWGNHYELTLAREFVEGLDEPAVDEPGQLLVEVVAEGEESEKRAEEIIRTFKDKAVIGLWAREGVPTAPDGPAVACKVRVEGDEATIEVASSDKLGRAWTPFGEFTVPVVEGGREFDPIAFADAVAAGLLDRLVLATLSRGPRENGKPTYRVKIENASPLILDGLAIAGAAEGSDAPRQLTGIGLSPRRGLTVPASAEAVESLGLKEGVRVVAADLSGL